LSVKEQETRLTLQEHDDDDDDDDDLKESPPCATQHDLVVYICRTAYGVKD